MLPVWFDRHRETLADLGFYLALLVSLVAAAILMLMVFYSTPADSATCASRPGISHGAVWWRWRYAESGARCWYPGRRISKSRLANSARRSATYAALRFRPKNKPPQTRLGKVSTAMGRSGERTPGELARRTDSLPVPPAATRLVRTVPVYSGLTPVERIERGFDKLIMFPAEDEP